MSQAKQTFYGVRLRRPDGTRYMLRSGGGLFLRGTTGEALRAINSLEWERWQRPTVKRIEVAA